VTAKEKDRSENRSPGMIRKTAGMMGSQESSYHDVYSDYQNIFESYSSNLPGSNNGKTRDKGVSPRDKSTKSTKSNKATNAPTIHVSKPTPSPIRFVPTPLHVGPSALQKKTKDQAVVPMKKPNHRSQKSMKDKLSRGKKSMPSKAPTSSNPPNIAPAAPSGPQPPVRPPSTSGNCQNIVAAPILDAVPEIFAQTPERCCDFDGPTAAIITHAFQDPETSSMFEPFWDQIYQVLARTSGGAGVCFFMTGIDSTSSRLISEIMIDVLEAARISADIPSIMSTDPTSNTDLIETIRSIADDPLQPSIGVFNAGYANIIVESILSGNEALPFVGYRDESEYGIEAGQATLQLLNGTQATPLCFNARVGVLDFIGQRCAAYYATVSSQPIVPEEGRSCSADSTPLELMDIILGSGANAVWSHVDCCAAMGEAVEMARQAGFSIVSGCQDFDEGGAQGVDFVTAQPIDLQGYHASTWSNFPVVQEMAGMDGKMSQYFPASASLINTAIYNSFLTEN